MEQSDMPMLKGVPETMLQTLYARARQSQSKHPLFSDKKAEEIVEKMNYDFSDAKEDKKMEEVVVNRTVVLDKMVREFLEKYPDSTVINMACGMDSRCYRNEGKFYRWYNIDLPDVMDIRSRFMEESDTILHIAGSVMDANWVSQIEVLPGKKVLVIIEGLTMYLSEEKISHLFELIGTSFSDVTIFTEVLSPYYVKNVRMKSIEKTKSSFTWGAKNGKTLARLAENFRHVKDLTYTGNVFFKMPLMNRMSNRIVVMEK